MKAVLLREYGGPDQLRYEETETPEYGDGEVLVRVRATSVNPVDYKIRSGAARQRFPVDFPGILGRDLAGEVVESGPGVVGFPAGMRVLGLANGTYAEYAVAKADTLAPIPDELSFEQAAALPLVTLTGTQLIERAMKVQSGWTILVTGALGSVGRTAVHVARQHGARVLAGVRGAETERALQALNVDGTVALDDEQELARLKDLDAIADTVGPPVIQRLLHAVKSGGVIGSVLGPVEGADKLGIRVEAMMAVPDASRLYALADEAAHKAFSIPIARTMKLAEIAEAHRLAEGHKTNGKIVLVP